MAFVTFDGLASTDPVHGKVAQCPQCRELHIFDLTRRSVLRPVTPDGEKRIKSDRLWKVARREGENYAE